jgi:hypothetical protein
VIRRGHGDHEEDQGEPGPPGRPERGSCRSDLIRRAVNLWLDAVDEAAADIRYAEAYRRIPDDLRENEPWEAAQLETWPEW